MVDFSLQYMLRKFSEQQRLIVFHTCSERGQKKCQQCYIILSAPLRAACTKQVYIPVPRTSRQDFQRQIADRHKILPFAICTGAE